MLNRLFVYGTLRHDSRHPMAGWLRRHGRLLGAANIRGWLYRVGSYPGLILDSDGEAVMGELYQLRYTAAALRLLDRYEGCLPGQLRPYEFVRRPVLVTTSAREPVPAWVYLFNRPVDSYRLIRGGNFTTKGRRPAASDRG